MFYVYVLRSLKDKKLYIGKTSNLRQRFKEHNSGLVPSTKGRKPFELLFYEGFKDKTDAGRDELFYKSGFGKEALKSKLKYTLK